MGERNIVVLALSPLLGKISSKGWVPKADIFGGVVKRVAQIAKGKKGSLLVLAVDTQKNINERPATQQLLESIDRYVKSDKFAPQITVDESYIESFLKK